MEQKFLCSLIITLIALPACQTSNNPAEPTQPVDTDTTVLPRTLTICMGYEPQSLYPYAASSQAARDILQAIYDGPFNEVNGETIPVILESMPSYADGSASFTPISVKGGDQVVNIYGQLISLSDGAQVFPSGCTSPSCAISWDGTTALQMDQPSATWRLISGLSWSDGQPLTAADSVYSFNLAADADTPVDKTYVDQTASYSAVDESTLQWAGKPGLVTDAFEHYFWLPLPQHAWGAYTAAELLASDEIARKPLGWGAYVLDEWVSGQYIRLKKNPFYFRADEGLPKFDYLVFKFTNRNGDTNLSNLKFEREPFEQFNYGVGEFADEVNQNGCDLTTTSADMSDQLSVLYILQNYYQDPAVKVMDGLGKHVEWLIFNLRQPTTAQSNQPVFFNDFKMREAISYCLDRETMLKTVFFNFYDLPDQFSFSYKEESTDSADRITFDPAKGQTLLAELGWADQDPEDDLPRTAKNVEGISDGTVLSLNYLVKSDAQSLAVADQLKTSLADCGIQVNINSISAEIFWNRSSEDSIFQGNFDLAQIEWELPIENPCPLFSSANNPQKSNDFSGLNFGSISDAQLDSLCTLFPATQLSDERQAIFDQMEVIINENLAVVPLFTRADLMIARNDFCDAPTTLGSQSELFVIEAFDYNPACKE